MSVLLNPTLIRSLFGLSLAFLIAGLCQSASAQVAAPFPMQGPRVGIHVVKSSVQLDGDTYAGALVTSWNRQNRPYRYQNNGRRYYDFRIGYDVILLVNGKRSRSANEILRNTRTGQNKMLIYDRRTRTIDTYYIDLR
ncbi:MAG: hypothetical protein AAFP90_12810 [Planctomycetota bacterium]